MFSQQRYKNLISSVGKIYSADDTKARTEVLESSLCSVMELMNPQTDGGWRVVSSDTDRILKIWESLESTPTAQVIAEQVKDMLREFSSMVVDVSTSAPVEDEDMSGPKHVSGSTAPTTILEMLARQSTPVVSVRSTPVASQHNTPVVSVHSTPAVSQHNTPVVSVHSTPAVSQHNTPVVSAQPTPVQTAQPTPVLTAQPTPVLTAQPSPVVSVQPTPVLTAQPTPDVPAAQPTPDVPAAQTTSPTPAQPVPMDVDDVQEPEEETEEEEEEEEGAELEQITLRGRTYYFDRSSGSIYAILDDDEVGDEVGMLKDGKVRFYAK